MLPAPLTIHASPLPDYVKSMEDVLCVYVSGCKGCSFRECEAVFACVVSMFSEWKTYRELFSGWNSKIDNSIFASRMAYACIFALQKIKSSDRNDLKEIFCLLYEKIEKNKFVSLFDDYSLAVKDNEADICHINTSINRSDIIKMVPYFHI